MHVAVKGERPHPPRHEAAHSLRSDIVAISSRACSRDRVGHEVGVAPDDLVDDMYRERARPEGVVEGAAFAEAVTSSGAATSDTHLALRTSRARRLISRSWTT